MTMKKKDPPSWIQRLLSRFAKSETLEEVEGDLQEFYNLWVHQYGVKKANWKYFITVLTMLRPLNRKSKITFINQYFMFHSYFKMSWRSLLKNRVSAVINIAGLTLGLTTSILIMLVVLNEFSYNQFHTHLPDLHLLMKNQQTNEGIATGRSTPGPIADALKNDFSEVKFISRFTHFNGQQIIYNNNTSYESGVYVDPDLFRMMTFPSLLGDATVALESNGAVVISEKMAKKIFGEENPIGKTIQFNRHHTLVVGAVIRNIPGNSSVQFDMALPFSIFEKQNDWLKKWDDNRIQTWIQFQPLTDVSLFNKKVTSLLQEKTHDKAESLFAYPLDQIHLYNNFSNGYPNGGKITIVQLLIAFGLFMLLIACINFMNIATAQSTLRAKEVGVRKVLGASRQWIILQFLNESFLVTFLSLAVAIVCAYALLPMFNTLIHNNVDFNLLNGKIWAFMLIIGLFTALLAGSYPSLFLSQFTPARVLKGSVLNTKGGVLRKALVTVQFAISIFFLISTIILYAQFNHVKNRPIGYEQDNLLDVHIDSVLAANFNILKNEVLQIPDVKSVTGGSDNILYVGGSVTGMDWPGKKPGEDLSIAVSHVDYDWTKTIGIQMIEGRDFDPAFMSDTKNCLINESAVAKMGLENPVGSTVGGHTVVGVFQNFVFNNPTANVAPMAVYLQKNQLNHFYVRIQNNSQWRNTIAEIEKITKKISPELPFSFSYVKDEYQNRFNEMADASMMISIFGGMTIFISCLGLFGLSGFIAERRSKEMSIRKVFGASIQRVLLSLSRDFLKPVIYALVIVTPLTVVLARFALSNINYRVSLTWWMFASGGLFILLISMSIVLYHGWRTARENPIVRLRDE